jgi:hypothetical protein
MNDGTTPLILAARLAVEGMVAELINCQADVNAVDDHGRDKDVAPSAESVSTQETCYPSERTFSDLKLDSPLSFPIICTSFSLRGSETEVIGAPH